MKRIGLITASPSEYLVHQRLGRTRFPGRGRAALILPWVDRYCLIPSSAHSVSFCADQITAENQGVEISGFAIWNVEHPERAVESVDFSNPAEAIRLIGEHLREVVESAIRHQVANLSLEDALRKRGSIITLLKKELADVADKWGLAITTVEIKTVRIMSAQLFENMQARFRDVIRLESECSALEADEAIALQKAAVREEAARRELEFRKAEAEREETLRRTEIERDSKIERLKAAERTNIELAKLEDMLRLTKERESSRREAAASEQALIELDEALETRRFQLEKHRIESRDAIATVEDTIERRKIETDNTRDVSRMFVESLPGLLNEVKIGNINLGDPLMVEALGRFARSLAGPVRSGAITNKPGEE